MQNRILLNLVLFLIVLGLGAVALLKWKSDVPPVTASLTNLDKNQVQQIIISRAQTSDIKLQKQDTQWQIVTPLQLPANQFRIDSILQFLTTKHYVQLNPPIDFAELGLDEPEITLTIDDMKLGLGKKSPFNDGRRYILLNHKAYLATDTISYFLTGDAALFASLHPLGQQPVINYLKLPNLELQLQTHRWEFLTPLDNTTNNSADAIQGLIKVWQNLQALSVRRYELQTGDFGQIEIGLENEKPLQLKIIATEPEFILARPEKGIQYQIASEQIPKLFSLPEK